MKISEKDFRDLRSALSASFGYCTLCGFHTQFLCYEPAEMPCKRNTFVCRECGSLARNRHVALAVLDTYRDSVGADCLLDFAREFNGSIYVMDVKESIYRSLKGARNFTCSEYIDGVPGGEWKDGVLCQDAQNMTFPDNSFDLLITEDMLEHVPFPEKAFDEIHRVLKPGGHHIGTIPIKWHLEKSAPRAKIVGGKVIHLEEPEYHGDPFRPEGILAYTDFGRDMIDVFFNRIGKTEMWSAHEDRFLEQAFGIYNSWVFVSRKT
ncbi:methyltransferase domain-containing protein [Roseomonas sp. E05]|uniref:class I SAM-dependent methyltransferase n=1 Tax=Roseomonas sp. E05 TaxID=3046310 RepID=UPI0024B9C9DA|nr:class I SAM-dependent methyltransferase [Roseomonas sp. E05]MDJ0391323.1 methyltransferase domain-containing protein [Roseomonas sp. E05]